MFDQMTSLSLSQVFKNIQCGIYQIKSVSSSKSDVWTKFGLVTTTDGVDLDFAAFKSCHAPGFIQCSPTVDVRQVHPF